MAEEGVPKIAEREDPVVEPVPVIQVTEEGEDNYEQFTPQPMTMDEEGVFNHFAHKTRQELAGLISRLNKLPAVILCGGLGMCFNCRNKDI